jgi:predicted ATPase
MEVIEKNIYVITGGPGFGKTVLTEGLRSSGFCCSGEFARELITNQQQSGGEILPWKKPRLFQQEVFNRRIAFYNSVPDQAIAFADRAIPDQLAFARYRGFGTPENLELAARQYRYAPRVFVTPPWPEIYVNDEVRTETFEEALKVHEFVVDTYKLLNYQIIELPLVPVSERIDYLLKHLNIGKEWKTADVTF